MNKILNTKFNILNSNSTSPKKTKFSDDRGLVKMIIVIVVALLVLSYFGFNLRNIASSPTAQDNFSYVWGIVTNIWTNYLAKPAMYVWEIIMKYILNPILHNVQPKDMDLSGARQFMDTAQASSSNSL